MPDEHARPTPFEHVHAPSAEDYRRVMRAFVDAKRNYLVHRRPEDVAETLAAGGPALDAATVDARLTQLVQWGNLRRDLDTGRVTTVEDFYRPRYLYQLTAEGEAAELALDAYDRALGRRGELQSIALEDISVRLHSLRQEIDQGPGDPAVGHALLRDLTGLLDSLASNASQFMASLQRTIDLQDVDEDAFIAYKDRLIDYLSRFVGDLAVKSAEIAA
ncbi:MAG: TIGR02677 family protein, partial [Candidatus Dormibacteraceae bacterium]